MDAKEKVKGEVQNEEEEDDQQKEEEREAIARFAWKRQGGRKQLRATPVMFHRRRLLGPPTASPAAPQRGLPIIKTA